MRTDGDRDPFFYFVKDGAIVDTFALSEWSSEGCARTQETRPDCEMWAYRYYSWIRFNKFNGLFDTKDILVPHCLNLVLLLE